MKQKILYIAITIIVLSVLWATIPLGFVLFRPIKNADPHTTTKTETTYSPGNTQQLYKKGKDSIAIKTKSIHTAAILKSSAADSTYTFTKQDSSFKLSVNIQPTADGNLSMDYFLDITTKDLVRIDTIYQTRIDTIKIKQTILKRIDPPFYNTFIFGAIVATAAILLILHFIP